MSRYEALLIRAGLVYLVVTGLLGLLFFLEPSLIGAFRVTHVHLGLLGFFLSLVMGVAYWMMPRPGGIRQERQEAWTFYFLNGGLMTRAVAEPWLRLGGPEQLRGVLVGSGVLLVLATVTFALAMNVRVRTAAEIQRLRALKSKPE